MPPAPIQLVTRKISLFHSPIFLVLLEAAIAKAPYSLMTPGSMNPCTMVIFMMMDTNLLHSMSNLAIVLMVSLMYCWVKTSCLESHSVKKEVSDFSLTFHWLFHWLLVIFFDCQVKGKSWKSQKISQRKVIGKSLTFHWPFVTFFDFEGQEKSG